MQHTIETPTAVRDIVDNAEERELWIVGREFERPPYFHAGKGGDTRLTKALRLCIDEKITPNSDGSYQVEGSAGRSYRVGDSCSCPNSQKASTKWCYHAVGVALYVEWQRRLRPMAPVALGTLRAGTLPLPPATVEERLAQAPTLEERQRNYTQASLPPTADDNDPQYLTPPTTVDERLAQPVPNFQAIADDIERERLALGTIHDATALSTHHTPQEDRMADDEYIPEPEMDDAPVAVEDEPELLPPAPVKIPREFTVNIKGKVHVLYTGLVLAARANGLVTLSADWTYNDAELSLAHAVCTFADGRRYEESGDASPSNVNKGISLHFRRVALTRAKARCLRDALGISECSVEELAEDSGKAPVPDMTPALNEQDLRRRIWQRVKVVAPDVNTKEAVEAVVSMRTGLTLIPDNYRAIIELLERK